MERRKIHNLVDKKVIRPILVWGIVLSPFITADTIPTTRMIPPIVNSESFIPESVQTNYLATPILLETVKANNETPDKRNSVLEGFRLTKMILSGVAGNYSREGCLGCSEKMIMSNGEPLDDNQLTLAAPKTIPLNTPVLITNTLNNKSVIARVTDRGGFSALGRIADLTPAVKTAIEGETDLMDVEITVLEPVDSIPDNP